MISDSPKAGRKRSYMMSFGEKEEGETLWTHYFLLLVQFIFANEDSTWLKFDNYTFIYAYACTVDYSLFSSFLTLYTIDIKLHNIKALEVVLWQDAYMDGKQKIHAGSRFLYYALIISQRNVLLHLTVGLWF